jgi:hypothetical protein
VDRTNLQKIKPQNIYAYYVIGTYKCNATADTENPGCIFKISFTDQIAKVSSSRKYSLFQKSIQYMPNVSVN